MKNSRVYVIIAAVYLAPHMTPAVSIGCGAYMAVCALFAMWREA